MSKASFMSMRWLRLHIKEIIWATVLLFVGSIFIIGYGTSRSIQQQEERKKQADESAMRAEALKNMIPGHLQDKVSLPVAHVSYPTDTASLTTVIDVKTVWRTIKDTPEYSVKGYAGSYQGILRENAQGKSSGKSYFNVSARIICES
jgi:hypothetical protein